MTESAQPRAPLPHDALLTLARKTDAAAIDGDRGRLAVAARHLLDALVDHIAAERAQLSRLPADERRAVAHAQRAVVSVLLDVLVVPGSEPCHCTQLTQELLALLSVEADDERLTFSRDDPTSRSTAMRVTEPLRREHADLRPHLAELVAVAVGLDRWAADTPERLRGVVEFLAGHLVPHARAEEAVLYPAVEEVMRAPGATDTMIADHAEIMRRIDALAATVGTVGNGPATTTQAEQLRAQLYGLGAILELHFAKEEEVLLPVLDAQLGAEDAAQLFTRMHAVAHPEGAATDTSDAGASSGNR